jgi:hypothetical protein
MFGASVQERRRQHARALDGRPPTPEQLRQLGRMVTDALTEIRARNREPEVVFALADAFHNLPWVIHHPQFSWSRLLIFLEALERDFPEIGHKYMVAFDQVVGFRAEPGAAPDPAT